MLSAVSALLFLFFFFSDTATTEIYTLSLHDALPISTALEPGDVLVAPITDPSWTPLFVPAAGVIVDVGAPLRSEEHTSELQSHVNLVCRLLLEKKKINNNRNNIKSNDFSKNYSNILQ